MAHEAAGEVARAAKAVAAAGGDGDAKAAAEKKLRDATRKLADAKKLQDMRAVRRMLAAARSEPAVCVPVGREVFDTRPHLLNCPNGTVDQDQCQVCKQHECDTRPRDPGSPRVARLIAGDAPDKQKQDKEWEVQNVQRIGKLSAPVRKPAVAGRFVSRSPHDDQWIEHEGACQLICHAPTAIGQSRKEADKE